MKIIRQLIKFTFICPLLLLACGPSDHALNLDELTISRIHDAYMNGTFDAEQLTRAYLHRIEKMDASLNAVTVVNPEAIDIAAALDAEFEQSGKLRPLHGIPVIVKDNINTRDLLTTAGSRALVDYYPESDAFIIEKLKDAGAIILAKSNMAEWAFSPMHTESTTFGITRNPYDTSRVPAGSSGGTAAAVAANFGTIGLGTDTGNSIRGPSSHCSLVGFRTTMGLISREGIVPLYLRNDIVGPMCRTVSDAVHVLEVIAGRDPADSITFRNEKQAGADYSRHLVTTGLSGKRIGVLRNLMKSIDPEISTLFQQALTDMEKEGAEIIDPVQVPGFDSLRMDQWCAVFRTDVENFIRQYVRRDTVQSLEDIIRIGTNSEYARESLEYFRSHEGREGNIPCRDAYTDERRVAFRQSIEHVMDSLDLDAVVYPTWNFPPAYIESFEDGYRGDNSQIISPHTGQPAFTVPMGFIQSGLPAGLQILGRMFSEPVLIEISYAYEQATLHRKSPEEFRQPGTE